MHERIQTTTLAAEVLKAINALRREVGDNELPCLPEGSRTSPDSACPIARALTALVRPAERRMWFHHPWYAAAATKLWRVPFTDTLLTSVEMPTVIYEFAVAFRAGAFPKLEAQ
jgi:hypothetical protein